MRKSVILVLLLAICEEVLGYRILVMVPPPARSHYNLGKGVADILHERGHEVTIVAAFETKPGYREVVIPELLENKDKDMNIGFETVQQSKMQMMRFLNNAIPHMVELMMSNKNVKALLSSDTEKFDVVIVEYFINDMLLGLGVKYDCPVVLISPVSLMNWIATLSRNPVDPATIPNVFLTYSSSMTLWQRVANTGVNFMQEIMGWWMFRPIQKQLYEQYFPSEAARVPFEQLEAKVAAVLVNTHPSIGVARPLLPNTVEIGGYHIGEPEAIPEDLLKVMNESKHGVIYFSMGSNLKSSMMSLETRQSILKALAQLKQTVLWKFEEELPGKPDNVVIRKWMPQTGILAHKNTLMFISHGGLLSCTEAAHAGVPLLAIPIFGDQNHNAMAVKERGHGLIVEYENITEQSLLWGINELINNQKYTETAKRVSNLFHDRPMRPRDLVSYYVEHAVRSGGAAHLRPPQLSRCSQLLLDVMALLVLPPCALLLLIAVGCRRCFLSSTNSTNKTKGKQSNSDKTNKEKQTVADKTDKAKNTKKNK